MNKIIIKKKRDRVEVDFIGDWTATVNKMEMSLPCKVVIQENKFRHIFMFNDEPKKKKQTFAQFRNEILKNTNTTNTITYSDFTSPPANTQETQIYHCLPKVKLIPDKCKVSIKKKKARKA